MNVLVFTSLFPNNIQPHHGCFIKERMTQFARFEGCQVKVVAPVPYFPPLKINHRWRFSQVAQRDTIEGLEVYHPRYVMIPKIAMVLHGALMFSSVLSCVAAIRKSFDFDLIDAHYVYPDGLAAVWLGHVLGKPVVVSARGSDINLFKGFPLIRRLLRYTLRRASRVIAVSQALKEAIAQLDVAAEKIAVIPNGVDHQMFYPYPPAIARMQLGLPNKKLILSVGHLTPNKGFDLLIKSIKMLRDEFREQDLYLVIVGEGGFRRDLEKLIAALHFGAHVRLVGEVAHRELYLWYSAADLFCLASSREGWPNVVLEALACGTPVIATAVGGIPEIICSDEVGLLAQRSEQDLAAKISLAFRRPWRSDAIVRHARMHTWDRVARSVFGVFAEALGAPASLPHTTRVKSHKTTHASMDQ